MTALVPDNFVWGQMHHSRVVQHVVVPDHTKLTLLKQCLVSQTSLIKSNLVCLSAHTLVLLLLCHLPTRPMVFTILAAVMFDRTSPRMPHVMSSKPPAFKQTTTHVALPEQSLKNGKKWTGSVRACVNLSWRCNHLQCLGACVSR